MKLASKETVTNAAIAGCILSSCSTGSLSCSSLIIIIIIINLKKSKQKVLKQISLKNQHKEILIKKNRISKSCELFLFNFLNNKILILKNLNRKRSEFFF